MATNPLAQFHGELLALQIVVQRLLGQMAIATGHPVREVMRAEHRQASNELAASTIIQPDPAIAAEILDHAQAMLDDIYSVAAGTHIRVAGTPRKPSGG